MTDEVLNGFAPFIREYVYSHGWTELREVQAAAAKCIFETDDNLLLTSATASGKTEACFFPILSQIEDDAPQSVAVLYVSPLKSLINDQFDRLGELLAQSGIPVTRWHGDVSSSQKKRFLDKPRGILQTTPESLEAMLLTRPTDIYRLFCDLRFIVIDEIHTLTGSDRGAQIICQLCRIGRIIRRHPRRIGLSATIGSPELAAEWLGAGSGRKTFCPQLPSERMRWRLGIEHFFIGDVAESERGAEKAQGKLDAGYEFIYDCVAGKKALVFSNSREETEHVTATLRRIAARRGDADVFYIHHGNLSSTLREEAETKMKNSDEKNVTCATVTMELGIDIGKLERVVQNGAPHSVAGFLQRLGRSGRRGQPPEMMMALREERPLAQASLPQALPWDLLCAIAAVQLYIERRFVEPPAVKKMPFSLAFHQTLAICAASGELRPSQIAERVLSLPPFAHISKEDYRELLISMIKNEYLEMTEQKGVIVGLRGERLIAGYKFYAVFKDSDDMIVRCASEEIGTISRVPAVGERFALAGRVWETEEVDVSGKKIYVKPVEGTIRAAWHGERGEVHTELLRRMRRVLEEDIVYPYLKPNATARLAEARNFARTSGITERSVVNVGGNVFCFFPWLGTRSFEATVRFLRSRAAELRVSGVEYEDCRYILFRSEEKDAERFARAVGAELARRPAQARELVAESECPLIEKFDACIPADLLRRAYAEDWLDALEAAERLAELANEFGYGEAKSTNFEEKTNDTNYT